MLEYIKIVKLSLCYKSWAKIEEFLSPWATWIPWFMMTVTPLHNHWIWLCKSLHLSFTCCGSMRQTCHPRGSATLMTSGPSVPPDCIHTTFSHLFRKLLHITCSLFKSFVILPSCYPQLIIFLPVSLRRELGKLPQYTGYGKSTHNCKYMKQSLFWYYYLVSIIFYYFPYEQQ